MRISAPAVSIILPTYDRAQLIPRAIRSVLAQTFASWELIVVDDGSTDGTAEAVQSFTDPRIRYVPRQHNGGVAAARNTGLAAARGALVTFLDSDDEYLPTKLQQQVDALAARSDVKAIECALRVVTDGHEEVIGPFLAGMSFEDFLGFEHGINIGTLLLRRDLAAAVGFDEAIKVDDWDFVLRMLAHAQVAAIDRPLLVVHNLPGPRLSTAANIMAGWQQVIRKHEGAIRNKPRLLARWYHRMAFFYIGFGDLAAARRELLRAVRLWPWNLARWLLLLATLMGGDVFTFILGAYRRAGRFKKRLGRRPRTSWAEGV